MKKTFTLLACGIALCASAQIPTDSLALWLRADSGVVRNGTDVSVWNDLSGNNRNATAVLGSYPQYDDSLFCEQPAIHFGGSSGMAIPAFQTWTNKRGTMFVVARGTGGTGGGNYGTLTSTYYSSGIMWQFGLTGSTYGYYDGVGGAGTPVTISPPSQMGIVTAKREEDDTMLFYKSGMLISQMWINNNQPDINPFFIGFNGNYATWNGEALIGDIAEIIFYNKALTPAEQYQVDVYLANKYCLNTNIAMPAATDQSLCGPGSLSLTATGAVHYRWYDSQYSTTILDTNATFITPVLNATDTFWVANYNDTLESQRTMVIATMHPLPVVNFVPPMDTLCGSDAAFALNTGSPVGGIYSGAAVNAGFFDPALVTGLTTVTYTYTDSLGCTNSDTAGIYVDLCLGMETAAAIKPVIYPVPASEYFVIDNVYDAADVIITNALGETVSVQHFAEKGQKTVMCNLSAGLYSVSIITDGQVYNMKLVIQ